MATHVITTSKQRKERQKWGKQGDKMARDEIVKREANSETSSASARARFPDSW